VPPDERFARTLYEQLRVAEAPAVSLSSACVHLPPRSNGAAGIGGAAT